MNNESMINELTIDELDAASGGASNLSPFEATYAGLVKGFLDAGGEVTCIKDSGGIVGCFFKP